MKVSIGNEEVEQAIKCWLRFDFPGYSPPGRFLFGRKDTTDVAEEYRQKQVANWENIPVQGINIEQIKQKEVYTVFDEELEEELAYAPVELIVTADLIEDLLPFILKEEFRKIEFYQPDTIDFTKSAMEKFLVKIKQESQQRLDYEREKHTN